MRCLAPILACLALLPLSSLSARDGDASAEKVQTVNVRLLAPQNVFARNLDVKKLASLTREVQKNVARAVDDDAPACQLMVKVTLSPDESPRCELFSKGAADKELLQAVYDRLQKLPDLRTKADTLPFEVVFQIQSAN